MRRLRTRAKWIIVSIVVLSGVAVATSEYRRIESRSLPITKRVGGVTVSLKSAIRKPGGPVIITVTGETNVPDMNLGQIQVDGRECSTMRDTAYPDLDRGRLRADGQEQSSALAAMMAKKIFTNEGRCDRYILFNTIAVTQPVYIQHRVAFRFERVSTDSLPVVRRDRRATVTLTDVFLDEPSSPTWPLGFPFVGPDWNKVKGRVFGLVLRTDFPEGYIWDGGCTLTDDSGIKHESVDQGGFIEKGSVKSSSDGQGRMYVYMFKGIARLPKHVSFQMTGTLPPEKPTLVRFPRIFVTNSAN